MVAINTDAALKGRNSYYWDKNAMLLSRYEYDAFGNVTKAIDPLGRETRYKYDSTGIDLVSVRQKNESGSDLLDTVTYDAYGRVRTVTNRDGYTMRTEYDAMDRPIKAVYPDSTYEEFVYDKLDLGKSRDRRGRWSHFFYNAVREVNAVRDALGRTTSMEWCGCGNMQSLTDPAGRTTKWRRDVQGRITEKEYPDGRILAYAYQNSTSLLRDFTDARDQVKNFAYFKDGNLKSVSYANAHITTPSVGYTYDSTYGRVLTMTDGVGLTQYGYHPVTVPPTLDAGRLAAIDGPWSNDSITFAYDSLGRVRATRIQGVLDSAVYDSLGRMVQNINALGAFTYKYVGATGRLDSSLFPNGQKTAYGYHNVAGDLRLQEIKNLNPAFAQLSRLAYAYDAEGQIKTWTQQADSAVPQVHQLAYDPVDQLLGDVVKDAVSGAVLKTYSYAYDKAGNRLSAQQDSVVHSYAYNTLNQLTSRQGGGQLRFRGRLSEPGTVTLDGSAATVGADTAFDAQATVRSGLDTVTVVARDYSDNARTNRYAVSTVGSSAAYTYDLNGNLTGDGARTYEWDAEDRLVAINQGSLRSEFTYDGQDRRVRIVELDNGGVISQKNFLWVGNAIAEERNATGGAVTKRYFAQGVQSGTGRFYYTRDHLGSIREVTDSVGTMVARYAYDPFGTRTKVSGGGESDFGFTGHYLHGVSGLHLTKYRAYSSELGRWISRDPIEEEDGPNLYAYVQNNPINYWDPNGTLGLMKKCATEAMKAAAKRTAKNAGKGKPPTGQPKPPEPNSPKPPSPGKKPDPRHDKTTSEQRDAMNNAQPNVNNPNGSKAPEWVTKDQAQAYRDKAAEAAKSAKNDVGRNVQEKREKYWDDVIKERFPD